MATPLVAQKKDNRSGVIVQGEADAARAKVPTRCPPRPPRCISQKYIWEERVFLVSAVARYHDGIVSATSSPASAFHQVEVVTVASRMWVKQDVGDVEHHPDHNESNRALSLPGS